MSGSPLVARGNITCNDSPSIKACAPGIEVAHTMLRTLRGTIVPGAVIPDIPFVAVAESELITFSLWPAKPKRDEVKQNEVTGHRKKKQTV